MADKDMYGTTLEEAQDKLITFLRQDLQEPEAQLANLHLEQGRWQSHVNNSQRGIRVVFLEQHNGVLAPGHMTRDAHPETPLKEW